MPVLNPRWKMSVTDLMPEGCDGTGHWPGIECPCEPDTFTDGRGGFAVYHNDFQERVYER